MNERLSEIYQDTPDHQAGQTSSIGGLWPPEEASFNRIKAVDTRRVHNTFNSAINLIEEIDQTRSSIFGNIESGVSRIQFRGVLESKILRELSALPKAQEYIEAIVPLEPRSFSSENPILVYLGSNNSTRLPSDKDLARINENIKAVSPIHRRELSEIFSKLSINGYEVEILQEKGQSEIDQLAVLYERFGWSRKDVIELLQNPSNIFSVARLGTDIVSAGIAEIAQIPIEGDTLRMAEITEAATLAGHDGQGLYTAVSASLLIRLEELSSNKQLGGPIDLVFGECNGLSRGVLKVAKIQGRTLATEVGNHYGFPNSGILKQQVPISGAERNTPYNDLVPAFLTTSRLINHYGNTNY